MGAGNRDPTRELGIAERTVKAHIARIVEKLEQQTRLQVAVLAVLAPREAVLRSAVRVP
ncbi:LuxR C-terminal-related transcriptional regulator [Streptomyces sp. NBC_01267]|uniref:LuxR C-terminal-related transcriptional regulator n=1 Tax=unclassified Streptomyces TaxID=2593676 RepID=UPI002E378775|nr:LuxR C-terminal-related transcriptional regulator [Streptomyces sp. NBC_01267]